MTAYIQVEEGANAFRYEQEFRLTAEGPPFRVTVVLEYPIPSKADEGTLHEEIRQDVQKQILQRLLDNVHANAAVRIEDEFSE